MNNIALYSLRTDGDQYRITKFVDGNPEGSYLVDEEACECPAGHRHTCRHRQMLPQMLAHNMANTHWFMAFDAGGAIVDFNGTPKRLFDELAAVVEPASNPMIEAWGEPTPEEIGQPVRLNLPVPEGQHSELTIAHSITLPDSATPEDVANAFLGLTSTAKPHPFRRL